MKPDLMDKVIIITGAGSGIGRASSLLFAKEGAKIIVANRREEKGNETVELVKDAGGEAFFIQCDVSNEENVKNLIDKTIKKYGRLDGAFNNAGIVGIRKSIIELNSKEFDEVIRTNLFGTFLLVKYQVQQMLKQKSKGSIVNITSVAGLLGRPGRSPYNSSRSGIIALTRTAAIEYIKNGIRINCLAPGVVKTDLFQTSTDGGKTNKIKEYEDAHPIGRVAEPEEVAESALWLLSDKSSFVVGHTLVVDGGYTIL
ncbi:MAG: glucose 1-dehydrogenase [Leptospiraceae bacterium]|nr:glucose 1-dehydrogenase [Leptospiraceae bacterium]MCP5494766.1 glucose 1-dehydrogenase [Leptospiraceae bacterium]